MLDQRARGWAERLRAYARGSVSYVDGCRDLRNFPADLGCYPVECVMSRCGTLNPDPLPPIPDPYPLIPNPQPSTLNPTLVNPDMLSSAP